MDQHLRRSACKFAGIQAKHCKGWLGLLMHQLKNIGQQEIPAVKALMTRHIQAFMTSVRSFPVHRGFVLFNWLKQRLKSASKNY